MENQKKNITIRVRTITILLVLSIIVQLFFITSMLWIGKGEINGLKISDGGWIDFMEMIDSSDIMTKAELATVYAKNHLIEFLLFNDSNNPDNHHWSEKEIHFFEQQTGITVNDPDSAVNMEMLRAWNPDINLDESEITRLQIFSEELIMYAKRFFLIFVYTFILIFILGFFSKFSQMICNILCIPLFSILMFGTFSRIVLLFVTIYILHLTLKNKSEVVEVEKGIKTSILSIALVYLLAFSMSVTELVVYCSSLAVVVVIIVITIFLWLLYINLWKKIYK